MKDFKMLWERLFSPDCFDNWLSIPESKCKHCKWEKKCQYRLAERVAERKRDESD